MSATVSELAEVVLEVGGPRITQSELAARADGGIRRVLRLFRFARPLEAAAAADILAWHNSGFSSDGSVRIVLLGRFQDWLVEWQTIFCCSKEYAFVHLA